MSARPRGICPVCEAAVPLKGDGTCCIHRVGPPLRKHDCSGANLAPGESQEDPFYTYPLSDTPHEDGAEQ